MNRYAISFTVKPGTEPQVAEVLRGYRRPDAGAATGGGPPLLHRTSVFMAGQRVVRVIDVAGTLGTVMRHLAAQPQIRAVEAALDPFLATPRDLDSPEGMQAFLHSALLTQTGPAGRPRRDAPGHPSGNGGGDRPGDADGDPSGAERCGLLFPVRPGYGATAAKLLAGGNVATTVFRRADVLVGLLEVDGEVTGALDRWAREACRAATVGALAAVVDTGEDLTREDGFRSFLESSRMQLLTDRRVAVPA